MKHALLTLIGAWLISSSVFAQIWTEDFEGNWITDWSATGGTWLAGVPTSGPDSSYGGQNCAATVLDGNYPPTASTVWTRHVPFHVPPANQHPRLRFWHWYSFSASDYGQVQVSTDQSATWTTISTTWTSTGGGVWTHASVDLSAWSDSTIWIGFLLSATDYSGNFDTDVSSGWYLDDLSIDTGAFEWSGSETFESGLGDWIAEHGDWEVGIPVSGPGSALDGINCAATVLAGNYASVMDTRLISPTLTVPAADANPRLRFWHWYSFSASDYGRVQISTDGVSWTSISPDYVATGSGVWTFASVDLSAWADSVVQLAFLAHATDYSGNFDTDVSSGWYIDDVQLFTGPYYFNMIEGFESGIGDWSAERGAWQVGAPTSGPGMCHTGDSCAATVLGGNYAPSVNSRMVSPRYHISPDVQAGLTFWYWYSFSASDYGEVHIRTASNPNWVLLSAAQAYHGESGPVWSPAYFSLDDYRDSTVQVAFFVHAEDYSGNFDTDVSSGLYIDDINIDTLNVGAGERPNHSLNVFPVPFTSLLTIQNRLGPINRVQIMDALGKPIRTLVSSNDRITWDGRTTSGTEVPPGLYLATVITDGQRYTQRVVKQ